MDPSQQFRQFFRTFLSSGRTIRPHPGDRPRPTIDAAPVEARQTGEAARPVDAA